MKILSIETSCDDTGITIMEVNGGITNASFKILADASNSQIASHIPYGGVYPALAKREHAKNLPILFEQVMEQLKSPQGRTLGIQKGSTFSRFNKKPVDVIAVTYGPGLEMCLWEGITFAKDLAKKWKVPLIPTNHMEGHILSVFGKIKKNKKRENMGTFKIPKVQIPILSLLVSGGHTQLIVSKKWMQYEIIGETLDDAVGEAYDKVARMLGLDYPGGPQISALAEFARKNADWTQKVADGKQKVSELVQRRSELSQRQSARSRKFNFKLPRPMMYSKDFKFSYSGLKTAVLYLIRDLGGLKKLDKKTISQIALEFENAAVEVLIYKTAKAIEKYNIKTVIVGGGVACNTHLQRELKKLTKRTKIKLLLPQKELTGDNSLMIGIAGYLQYIKLARRGGNKNPPKDGQGKFFDYDTIKATGNLKL